MRSRVLALALLITAALAATAVAAFVPGPKRGSKYRPPVSGRLGVIATESPAAARAGRAVLEHGGNAIDAAATTVFALGAARPQSCGIGGGGFLVYRSAAGKTAALDFRETAPHNFTPTTLQGKGPHEDFTGHLTVGVPGTVAGMAAALRRYGTISLARAVGPAESYARHGVRVTKALAATLSDKVNVERMQPFAPTKAIYRPGGKGLEAGAVLKNPDLANSYARIRALGVKGFYGGRTAQLIAQDMQRSPVGAGDERGRLDLTDLAKYRAKWRRPVTGTFRGRKVIGMPPPTSGGVAIQEMLNLLRGFDLDRRGRGSAETLHLIAEAQKIAWADRGKYLGDPDFVSVPTRRLTSRSYAAKRRRGISLIKSRRPKPGVFKKTETGATTHVAVIDAKGNAVSVTCTIEQELGSAVVAPGTGILLNNEMTDFGAPGTANEARAGKRPRSSMSPEIVTEARKPIAVTGGAGGSRIIMGTLFAILGRVEFGLPLASAVDAPRLDAQGELADAKKDRVLIIENTRFRPSVLRALAAKGHTLQKAGEYDVRPRVQAAGYRSPKHAWKDAVSDPRTEAGSLAQRR